MHPSSIICSLNLLSSSPIHHNYHQLTATFRNRFGLRLPTSLCTQLPLSTLQIYRRITATFDSTATEISKSGLEFVEVGYICNVHGLQGEIRVKPSTDFPELRFSEPGRRWLRQQVSGRETVQEVELIEGRHHPGQKSWILRLNGIESVDQAKQLVGSTLLVREEDRPELEEGEFYTPDLVGMRVILEESGELVGTVVNVFKSGASDLLQVMLDSSGNLANGNGRTESVVGDSARLVWVPFVEAIVPIVNMIKREMYITPPKGLLQLNLRADERSKKERRQLEWQERKKFQKRLIAAKKKLCEMEQQHVFHGFRYGEKAQRSLLANQIVGINSKLLQHALQNIQTPSKRWSLTNFVGANTINMTNNTLKISKECLTSWGSANMPVANFEFHRKGVDLTLKGKVATVLVMNDMCCIGSSIQQLLHNIQRFIKVEDLAAVPLVTISSASQILSLKNAFSEADYFAFDPQKVWFVEEEKLPVVSNSLADKSHKILMKSPWEILQSPVGTGGVIGSLSSNNILETLGKEGVEYIEVFCAEHKFIGGPLLLGFMNSRDADVGIQIFNHRTNGIENFPMIFSIDFMKKLADQINRLQFHAVSKANAHVELVDKEWVDVNPSSPNSYVLSCSICSYLNACSPDKVCLVDILE